MAKLISGRKVLITGGHGFVGHHLSERLAEEGAIVQRTSTKTISSASDFQCDLQCDEGWKDALDGVDTVIHLAARVHVMNDTAANPIDDFRRINCDGSIRVIDLAKRAGVRRLVFISTIKVLGESTQPGFPFNSESPLAPLDPYAVSKAEAEEALMAMYQAGDIEVVIIRPPLVYGQGVGGNLRSLSRLIRKKIPLPFGKIQNLRDLVSVENLCDLIVEAAINENAPGNRFLVSDGHPVSTPDLIRAIATGLDSSPRLLNVPAIFLRGALKMTGRKAMWDRISGNLEVDISGAHLKLGWRPPVSFDDGMERAFDSV